MTQEQWDKVGVEQWVYGTGLPVNCPFPASNRFVVVDDAVAIMLNVDPDAADARACSLFTAGNDHPLDDSGWLRYARGLEAGGATEGHYALADGNYGFSGGQIPRLWQHGILQS